MKDAVVLVEAGGEKVTVPGPLTFVHDRASGIPRGRPSSVAVPTNAAVAGNLIVRSGPASTEGD